MENLNGKFIVGMSNEDYHTKPFGYSASKIKKAFKSLNNFFNEKSDKERKTHFEIGNAFETLLLEPEKFESEVFVYDENLRPEQDKTFASKLNKEWKAEIFENNKCVITFEEFEMIKEMRDNCMKNKTIAQLISGEYIVQGSGFWTDEETELKLQTRPDFVKKRSEHSAIVLDVKTCEDASPDSIAKSIAKFDYLVQACTQIEGVEKTMDVQVDYYLYLFVEKKSPYNVTVVTPNIEDLNLVKEKTWNRLRAIKNALDTGETSKGYEEFSDSTTGIIEVALPQYYKYKINNL